MDQTLFEIMRQWPATIHVFIHYKMHCVGCPINRFHTVKDACDIYKLDESEFRRALGRAINAAPLPPPA